MARHIHISDIEAHLAANRVSVAELCRKAGISQSTWQRLKRSDGRLPRESTRRVIQQALNELAPAGEPGGKA